jgi:Ca2+-binding EF-hand superfamily protein
MKKLLPLVLATTLLAGCGAPALTTARTVSGNVSAQSKAGVEKAVMGMYKNLFAKADADKNGYLTVAELPQMIINTVDGSVTDGSPDDREAAMAVLDVNKNGRVTFNEFASKAQRTQVVEQYRAVMGRLFAQLDTNGDRLLFEKELGNGTLTMAMVDLNQNGKVTLSEFEDGVAQASGAAPAPAPVDPAPAPVDPAPAPVEPGDEPAPADEPSEG